MTSIPAAPAVESDADHAERPGWAVRTADAAIRGYQRLMAGRPSPCRYWPTCSNYAREAIQTHGLWRGVGLIARRLARCRPLASSGWDPVPPRQPVQP